MVEDNKMNKPLYRPCNIEELAECLAMEDWRKETSGIPMSDLFELVATPVQGEEKTVEMTKQIKGKWAGLLFDLKESYKQLIETYCTDENETTKEIT